MKCATCNVAFNDGVQCSCCSKHFDFNCAKVTEQGFRKLGSDRRAAWKCPQCKISPPQTAASTGATASPNQPPTSASPNQPASLETLLKEVREMKQQLSALPILVEDVKAIKAELSELKVACEFNCAKLEEYEARLTKIEQTIPDVEQLQATVADLRKDLLAKEQWSRLNNVEIKGIPIKKDENLFTVTETLCNYVGYSFPKHQIDYIARVPTYNSKDKSIIIRFINRYVKEEFVAAARAKKSIPASDIGFGDSDQRVFVNDHLTPDGKILLTKVKSVAKNKNYRYVWVKFCKIHVRKDDTSRVVIITSENDLNKIV